MAKINYLYSQLALQVCGISFLVRLATFRFHSFGPNLAVRSLRTANLPEARAEKLARYGMYDMSTVPGSLFMTTSNLLFLCYYVTERVEIKKRQHNSLYSPWEQSTTNYTSDVPHNTFHICKCQPQL